ncbi:Pumilio domain-containing protein C56F2.08c [Wallemia ichthyophaga EXF-994]|uniref:Pumilio domain-containing protein C56F2.08c n=1 Tax=Wallemia ichthyophaga (strain EXF-994 / CBS 113033) TaxID=1299270 RepID=R9AHP3_WALI9|nr:Pumilio domain-containing protein C56F2.08c [Wallemia ichthyophaga EXF-994]EOR01707.1 Pumilio domain-containing protein C56F2.08c [Wallemia ichthyophaga EXF-994]
MSSSNSNSNSNQNLQYLSKRALQIQHDEGVAAIPNKPSPANTPPVRRARAGTLPSNLSSIPNYPTQFNQPPPLNLSKAGLSPAAIESLDYASNPQKPGLRHSHSSALNFEKSPRLRSGSLTLPPSSPSVQRLADPFGSRFFYSRSNSQIGAIGDELKSSDLPSEDACLRTLDYLGLDDPPSTPSSPHTNHSNPSLSIPKPSHISLNSPTRSRAYTLSTSKAADPFKTSSSTSSPSCQPPNDHLHPDSASLVNNSNLNDYQSFLKDPQDPLFNSFNNPSYNSNSTQSSRPRAISMGILDEPDVIRAPARSGVPFPDSSHPHPLQQSFNSYDLEMSHLDDPYSSLNQVHTQQVPTRSLWIGGLDPRTTAQELMHVFAPYGAIESLRLLTDKECGFVNFVEKSDALRARDDVMHRLAGRIPISTTNGGANSSTPVRIGFGKIDSPQNPPSTSSLLNSTNNSTLSVPNSVPNQINFDGTTEQPTRALWLGSIPSTTTPATLLALFGPFGPIESARVLTHKNCGFVNYERLDDAVRARKSLNGRELLGPEIGAVRVGFAKVPVKSTGIDDSANTIIFPSSASAPNGGHPQALANSLIGVQGVSDIPVEQQIASGQTENYRSNLMMNLLQNGTKESVVNSLSPKLEKVDPDERPSVNDQQMIMSILSGGNQDDIRSVSDLRPAATYYTSIPPILPAVNGIDNQPIRKFDSSKLRELRKRLENQDGSNSDKRRSSADEMNDEYYDDENGQFPFSEDPEILATRPMSEGGLIDNIVDLASDYIGNTIIQKLFEVCTLQAKMCMLNDLAPHLAMIGCHKNGTWAAQKIIDCASTAEEINLIVQHIRPYAPPLLLDQFGNYVVQCCLRFGPPANDFIFDAMCDRIWDIAQGRFGARSMRAILESSHITLRQQKRLAISIILNSIPLATNPNGALLLTWLLDTSNLPGRYGLLAPRFTPHAAHLITHKLASLTVLRLVNQKLDREATNSLLEAIFESPSDGVLFDALMDPAQGVSVITKLIVSQTIDEYKRQEYMEAIKRVLTNGNVKITNPAAYRRLLDEINMPMNKLNIMQPLPGTTGGSGSGSTGGTPPTTTFSPQLQPMQPIYGGMTPPASLMNLQLQAHAQAQAQAAVLGHGSPPVPEQILRGSTGNPFNAFR